MEFELAVDQFIGNIRNNNISDDKISEAEDEADTHLSMRLVCVYENYYQNNYLNYGDEEAEDNLIDLTVMNSQTD